jgi:RNA polymerase sigma factor (sigma-70 family)
LEVSTPISPRAQEDLALVLRAKNGDQGAFSRIMDKYRESLYFLILKMVHNRDDAEDLTQEAFSKAFNSLVNYNADFAFSTWLFKIATNNCIDFLRKKRLQTVSLDQGRDDGEEERVGVSAQVMDQSLTPEEQVMKQQRVLRIRDAVDKLNPKYKMLIELRYFDELSYEEIAERMDIPLGTVKAQLFRAKEMLYTRLKDGRDQH